MPEQKTGYTLADVATERMPIRASSLYYLNCTLRYVLMLQQEREAGAAANTGTLIHTGIDSWIKGSSLAGASDAMRNRQAEFRRRGEDEGDLTAAERWLQQYAGDPRNAPLGQWPRDKRYGRVVHSEAPCLLRLPAAEFDPTGEDVCILGTCDQIREVEGGMLWLWDIKSSKIRESTDQLLLEHIYQTICYAEAAEQMLGRPVGLGGIISVRGYGARTEERQDVFIPSPLDPADKRLVLETIVERIALIRTGHISASIGGHCARCYISSLDECIKKLRSMCS